MESSLVRQIAVTTDVPQLLPTALIYAQRLGLNLLPDDVSSKSQFQFLLVIGEQRMELRQLQKQNSKPLYVDFLSPTFRYRLQSKGHNIRQLFARAIGLKAGYRPIVLDATAGFGADAFVLASLGCAVHMLERSPIIGLLLEDGYRRLQRTAYGQQLKLTLQLGSALDYCQTLTTMQLKPDVIYLDPMYSKRQKTALGKASFRLLHTIVGDDEDASLLLQAALATGVSRVVVKRLRTAARLTDRLPNLQFHATGSCRYDVYLSL